MQDIKSLKNLWITEQFEKIKIVVGNDFSDEQINTLLEKKWKNRKEPKYTLMMTKDSVSTSSVENMIDRFLNSNYIFSAYGVLYKQPTEHRSIFNELIWDVIKERKEIRRFIAEQREKRGEEFMLTEFTRYNSKQKNRKIVVNAAYGVIASFISVFFNSGLLMSSSQNSITKTGQTLTTIAISNIENWLENNIDFRNVSDLLDYVNYTKKHYLENKEINEKYLQKLEDISQDKFISYLFSLLESKSAVDHNYVKLISNRLTDIERKSIYYKNNIPAIFKQQYWKDTVIKLLDYEVNKDDNSFDTLMKEFNDVIFNTTAIDFIHPERFTRQWRKTRDATIISDTDSVFISVYDYVQKTKEFYNTDKLTENDLDMAITKIFINLSDVYIKYILNSYMDYVNVSDERKGDINMKSEYDYSKILVDGKKMYAGWKVGELSVPLGDSSEIDIKGLSIVKTVVVKTLRDKFTEILEENILNTNKIDTLDILYKFEEIEDDIRRNLKEGSTTYLQPASVSGDGAYKKPESVPPWRGVQIWNFLNPDSIIDLPGRVLQIRLTPLDDYSFLEDKHPEVYERLIKLLDSRVDLLGTKYEGNSKEKSNKKNVLDIISVPYQLEQIPDWIIPLIDIEMIVDRLMKPGQFILNAIGVSTPDDFTTNIVDRKIINQIMI